MKLSSEMRSPSIDKSKRLSKKSKQTKSKRTCRFLSILTWKRKFYAMSFVIGKLSLSRKKSSLKWLLWFRKPN